MTDQPSFDPNGEDFSDPRVRELYRELVARGQLVVTGIDGLHALKELLHFFMREKGISIEWDPTSPPALRDYLSVMSLSAARWALAGTAIGLILGMFTERPGTWAGVGTLVGSAAGGIVGHVQVRRGYRLRGWYDANGVENVEVQVLSALPEHLR